MSPPISGLSDDSSVMILTSTISDQAKQPSTARAQDSAPILPVATGSTCSSSSTGTVRAAHTNNENTARTEPTKTTNGSNHLRLDCADPTGTSSTLLTTTDTSGITSALPILHSSSAERAAFSGFLESSLRAKNLEPSTHAMARPNSSIPLPTPTTPVLNPRPTRESVLRRLSEALMRRSLTKIDMSQRDLRPSDARLIKLALLQNKHLHTLKLGYNHIGDEGLITLAPALANSNIQSLDLGFTGIGDVGMEALANAFFQGDSTTVAAAVPAVANGGQSSKQRGRCTALCTLYLAGNSKM